MRETYCHKQDELDEQDEEDSDEDDPKFQQDTACEYKTDHHPSWQT